MITELSSLYSLNYIPTGRRLFALGKVAAELSKMQGQDDLKALVAAAIAEDETTHDLEQRWAGQKKKGKVSEKQRLAQRALRVVDGQVDKTLTSLRDGAQTHLRSALPHETDLVIKVQTFLDAIFPAGVAAITSLPYAEELTAVKAIVARLKGDLAPLVTELGLSIAADRLSGLVGSYGDTLETAGMALEFGAVRAARAAGETRLLQVVSVITGQFYQSDGQGAALRTKLLAPILAQDEAVRQQIRERRAVSDVDPKTGEEKASEDDAGDDSADASGSGAPAGGAPNAPSGG